MAEEAREGAPMPHLSVVSAVGAAGGDGTVRVLLLSGADGWTLPRHDRADPAAADAELRRRFGVETTVLHAERAGGAARATGAQVFAHAARAPAAPLPAGAHWVPWTDLGNAVFADPAAQNAVHGWLADGPVTAPERHPPWARPGWFDEAQDWAVRTLRAAGTPATGPAEQCGLRAWSRVLRLPTARGPAYFKAAAPAFGHEAALTLLLAECAPGAVPEVIGADTGRHWLLTADFGPVPRERDPARLRAGFLAVAPVLARVQRAAARHRPGLAATGCPDHGMRALPGHFDRIAAGSAVLDAELDPEERRRLRAIAPSVAADCARLAGLGPPDSVVHLDLWRGNFTAQGRRPVLFDWAESVVSHPVHGLDVLLGDVRAAVPGAAGAAVADEVAAAYLGEWRDTRPAALLAARAPAEVTGLASRAVLWHDVLAALAPEVRRRYRGNVGATLRALLAHPRTAETPPAHHEEPR